jgi:hypothetical protein
MIPDLARKTMSEERHYNEVHLLNKVILAQDSELKEWKSGFRPYRVAFYSLSLAVLVLSLLLGIMSSRSWSMFLAGQSQATEFTCQKPSSLLQRWGLRE